MGAISERERERDRLLTHVLGPCLLPEVFKHMVEHNPTSFFSILFLCASNGSKGQILFLIGTSWQNTSLKQIHL